MTTVALYPHEIVGADLTYPHGLAGDHCQSSVPLESAVQ
jgi:hypothetical protein